MRATSSSATSQEAGLGRESADVWELWPLLLGLLLHSSAWSTVSYSPVNGSLNGRLSGLAITVPALAEAAAEVVCLLAAKP